MARTCKATTIILIRKMATEKLRGPKLQDLSCVGARDSLGLTFQRILSCNPQWCGTKESPNSILLNPVSLRRRKASRTKRQHLRIATTSPQGNLRPLPQFALWRHAHLHHTKRQVLPQKPFQPLQLPPLRALPTAKTSHHHLQAIPASRLH